VVKEFLKNCVLVDHVIDGYDAIAHCNQKMYDGILMDINLKGISGVEAFHQIRKLNLHYASVPVIAVTAYAMKGDMMKLLSEGFDSYISKPFKKNELLNLITSIFVQKI